MDEILSERINRLTADEDFKEFMRLVEARLPTQGGTFCPDPYLSAYNQGRREAALVFFNIISEAKTWKQINKR